MVVIMVVAVMVVIMVVAVMVVVMVVAVMVVVMVVAVMVVIMVVAVMVVIMVIAVTMVMGMCNDQTVVTVKTTYGKTNKPPRADPGCAQRYVFRADITVGQTSLRRVVIRFLIQDGIARNPVIAGVAFHAVNMESKITQPHIKAPGADHTIGDTFILKRYIPLQPFRHIFEDAVIDHIDDPAACPAAIQQGGRPTKDLNLPGVRRLRRHCMIKACIRHIHGADAVFQCAYPNTGQPTDDRTSCGRSKITGTDAWLIGDCIADVTDITGFQDIFGQHPGRPHQLGLRLIQRNGVDDYLL